jgi:hypothetical protein
MRRQSLRQGLQEDHSGTSERHDHDHSSGSSERHRDLGALRSFRWTKRRVCYEVLGLGRGERGVAAETSSSGIGTSTGTGIGIAIDIVDISEYCPVYVYGLHV